MLSKPEQWLPVRKVQYRLGHNVFAILVSSRAKAGALSVVTYSSVGKGSKSPRVKMLVSPGMVGFLT